MGIWDHERIDALNSWRFGGGGVGSFDLAGHGHCTIGGALPPEDGALATGTTELLRGGALPPKGGAFRSEPLEAAGGSGSGCIFLAGRAAHKRARRGWTAAGAEMLRKGTIKDNKFFPQRLC